VLPNTALYLIYSLSNAPWSAFVACDKIATGLSTAVLRNRMQ
jgi:hypothetical protein